MLGGLSAIAWVGGGVLAGALFGACVTLVALSPLGRASGAHLNPAVTVAFRSMGMLSASRAWAYAAAQLVGAVAGSLLYRALWGDDVSGTTHPAVPLADAVVIEAVLTAVLVATIFAFGARPGLAPLTPYAICPLIAVLVWIGGAATGASLNPARSLGPAVAFGDLADLWLYFAAPVAGALALASAWPLARPRVAGMVMAGAAAPRGTS